MTDSKPLIRKEVGLFTLVMEQRLCDNDHKGGWKTCSRAYLWSRLMEELYELQQAVFGGNGDITHEAADVANFAMMISDVLGSKNSQKKE